MILCHWIMSLNLQQQSVCQRYLIPGKLLGQRVMRHVGKVETLFMNLFCLIKYQAMHVEPTFQLTHIYLTTHAQNVLCLLFLHLKAYC